jgi:hypothetical protein
MVHKKIILALSLILIVLFITGCGSVRRGRDEPPVSAQFVATGTEGVVMKFLPEQPPPKVYTQGPLSFVVEVRNRGTYTVPSAEFYLSGFDPNILIGLGSGSRYIMNEQLDGKSQYNPEGGYSMVTFSEDSASLPSSMPNYKPTFLLTACYPYQTVATPLVCVDPNPLDTTSDKACRVQKVYGTGSQGAPVAVQSIEAEARPTGMFFRIHVANVGSGTEGGSGTVFSQDKLQSCFSGLQYSDLNTLRFEVDVSGQPLECQPNNGELRLVNKKGVVFCTFKNIQNIPAYQTPLNVRLFYGYKSSISKVVEIENLEFAR